MSTAVTVHRGKRFVAATVKKLLQPLDFSSLTRKELAYEHSGYFLLAGYLVAVIQISIMDECCLFTKKNGQGGHITAKSRIPKFLQNGNSTEHYPSVSCNKNYSWSLLKGEQGLCPRRPCRMPEKQSPGARVRCRPASV